MLSKQEKRQFVVEEVSYELREPASHYTVNFELENQVLKSEIHNSYWDIHNPICVFIARQLNKLSQRGEVPEDKVMKNSNDATTEVTSDMGHEELTSQQALEIWKHFANTGGADKSNKGRC